MARMLRMNVGSTEFTILIGELGNGILIPESAKDYLSDDRYVAELKTALGFIPYFNWESCVSIYGVDGYINNMHFTEYEREYDKLEQLSTYLTKHGVQPCEELLLIMNRLETLIPQIDELAAEERRRDDRRLFLANRKAVYDRDGGTCQYCGKKLRASYSVDHVIPVSQGGLSILDNLVLCCKSCNSKKGGRTPEEAGMKLQ